MEPRAERARGAGSSPAPAGLRRAGAELVLASFVVLFQELALIRWLPGQVRVVAYFPNLVLIAAFLGLGVGCLRAGRRSLLWLWPVSLLSTTAAAAWASGVAFTANDVSEHLWLLYHDLGQDAPVVASVRIPILATFVLAAVSFVPLGQFVAERLDAFGRAGRSLRGYALDLWGSLLGVAGFALLSFSGAFPVAWFAIFLAAGVLLVVGRRSLLLLYLPLAAATLLTVLGAERADRYSPYYALSVRTEPSTAHVDILTNGSLHQMARHVRREGPIFSGSHAWGVQGYHVPYDILGDGPRRVLVLGAGTGNDVSVALDRGAERVDVVEIDPVILDLGRQHHPDRPYASPRVEIFNTDARSFLNDTDRVYDLVVFGTLDSMTRLSAQSNVRLDNFVYTREAIRAARSRLAPGGGLVLYFMVGEEYIDEHLTALLTAEFQEVPLAVREHRLGFNTIYMSGPPFAGVDGDRRAIRDPAVLAALDRMVIPTDDWPYLYLPKPGLSPFYLSLMAIFLALGVLAVFASSSDMRRSVRAGRGVDLEMFLFGAAFLLLETSFVTNMNLAWGATWLTSAVVFGAILAMVLLGTLLTSARPLPFAVAAAGLVLSLLAAWVLPREVLLHTDGWVRLVVSVAFVGTPIFFASVCFALRFKARTEPGLAFGWNLLGAVAGGLLEFTSMAVGLGAMLLFAVAAYLGAFALMRRGAEDAPARSLEAGNRLPATVPAEA